MTKRDYYEVLEVSRGASTEEIKKAYRKKAIQYHPDKNPDNKESVEFFKEATEAYQILSDPENRRRYDQFGHAAFDQRGGGGFEGFGDFSGFEDIFGDIFGTFFGGGTTKRSRGRAGRDLRYDLQIEFEEAIFGAEKQIQISRRTLCEGCGGSGADSASGVESCQHCRGSGQIRMQQGFFTISRTCQHCGGAGQVIKVPCAACNGQGSKAVTSTISVKIPAGIDHGQRLKLRGEGEAGSLGGPSGDLYVQVDVKPHPVFQREESDLFCDVPISYTVAVLGAEVDVPSLEGPIALKIPAGTPSHKVFKMKGRGVHIIGSSHRGDLHIRVVVHVPKDISSEERDLLLKLRTVEGEVPVINGTRGFFDKVRDMFV